MSREQLLAYGYIVGVAFILSNGLILAIRKVALAIGILDYPGAHKQHREPKPLLGGVAVFLALLAVIGGHLAALPLLRQQEFARRLFPEVLAKFDTLALVLPTLWVILAGSVVVLITGLADDLSGPRFPAWAKLIGQTIAAALIVAAGVRVSLLEAYPWLAALATLVWIVGITNAFNLLDNMDGLATGVALICSLLLWLITTALGEFHIGLFLSALIGALAGFLAHNFPPARIFLGDAGSLLIGYVLGVITVLASYVAPEEKIRNEWFAPFMPVIVLGLPLYDMASVIWIRWREGRPIYRGDRSHLSHRLVELGMSEREAVGTIYLLTFCLGASALLLRDATPMLTLLALGQVAAIIAVTTILMVVPRRTSFVEIRLFSEQVGQAPPMSASESERNQSSCST
ncbi:MAG: undecaprenyl/decaprenyl-phosphate alpha-N-acetylglucosaminyl 1-phosphate transferase [Blastocatellia bacterium]|nr:undecaprenyl/decaprenyl-phosphate alpha-N-acetylglucosaminyl 1-phosphate transferase [Blastocatellia bacterium]